MSFEELQSVDTRAVKPEDVVDIQQIKIDDGLSQQEKRREFIRQRTRTPEQANSEAA